MAPELVKLNERIVALSEFWAWCVNTQSAHNWTAKHLAELLLCKQQFGELSNAIYARKKSEVLGCCERMFRLGRERLPLGFDALESLRPSVSLQLSASWERLDDLASTWLLDDDDSALETSDFFVAYTQTMAEMELL